MAEPSKNVPRQANSDFNYKLRHLYAIACAQGKHCKLVTVERQQYEGILRNVCVQGASLYECSRGSSSMPRLGFHMEDIISMEVKAVTPLGSKKFRTDGQISKRGKDNIRQLQPWQGTGEEDPNLALDYQFKTGAWDQFEANKRKFGVTTTYDENLYTTRVPGENELPEHIVKYARTLDSFQGTKDIGYGKEDVDEEGAFSAVHGSGRYELGPIQEEAEHKDKGSPTRDGKRKDTLTEFNQRFPPVDSLQSNEYKKFRRQYSQSKTYLDQSINHLALVSDNRQILSLDLAITKPKDESLMKKLQQYKLENKRGIRRSNTQNQTFQRLGLRTNSLPYELNPTAQQFPIPESLFTPPKDLIGFIFAKWENTNLETTFQTWPAKPDQNRSNTELSRKSQEINQGFLQESGEFSQVLCQKPTLSFVLSILSFALCTRRMIKGQLIILTIKISEYSRLSCITSRAKFSQLSTLCLLGEQIYSLGTIINKPSIATSARINVKQITERLALGLQIRFQ